MDTTRERKVWTGNTDADIRHLRDIARRPGVCALDFETTIARARDREVCTVQMTHEDGFEGFAYIYPCNKAAMKAIFADTKAHFVAFNSLFEAECLYRYGIDIYPECAMIAARVLEGTMEGDKAKRTSWSLAALAERKLGKQRDKTVRDEDWREKPTDEMVEYGMEDTRDALTLWNIWRERFDEDSWAGYRCVLDALPAIVESNFHGFPFNPSAHDALTKQLEHDLECHDAMLDLLCEGGIDNHGSTKQVGDWIMSILMAGVHPDQMGYAPAFSMLFQEATGQHWPLTKTQTLSLDRKTVESRLEALSAVAEPIAAYLLQRLQRQKTAKLLQAFGAPLRQFVDDDGYLRCTFKPHGAQTSRMSAVSPNLQQIPSEPEFRVLFHARPGRKLVICDYGQIELRVGCIIAGDTAMQTIFGSGADIHSATFENVQRAMGNPVTYDPDNPAHKKGRKAGKAVTFAALYGALAPTIAANSGIPLADAEELLEAWLDAYPGIRGYRDNAFDEARRNRGVKLVSGQTIRMAHDTRPSQAINAPVQGSSASVLYRAMRLTHDDVSAARVLGSDIWMCGPVHDEIILDCAEEDAEEAKELLQRCMLDALLHYYPGAAELGMASLAEAEIVDSWAEK